MNTVDKNTTDDNTHDECHSGYWDCSTLLLHVDQLEAAHSLQSQQYALTTTRSSSFFGHPDTPRLHLFSNNNNNQKASLLAVAYTQHCVSAQLVLSTQEDDSTTTTTAPMQVGGWIPNQLEMARNDQDNHDDEIITCLTVVALKQEETSSQPRSVAVVLGTSASHVYAFNLQVDWDHHVLLPLPLPTSNTNNLTIMDEPCWLDVLPLDPTPPGKHKQQQHHTVDASTNHVAFHPRGGVSSLTLFPWNDHDTTLQDERTKNSNNKTATYMWIAYRDGTVVRLHHAGCFASQWQAGAEQGVALDALLNTTALKRYHVALPTNDDDNLSVLPLPRYHPSVLSPLRYVNPQEDDSYNRDTVMDDGTTHKNEKPLEAMVYGGDDFPAAVFYSSEVQFWDREAYDRRKQQKQQAQQERRVMGVVTGATKKLVGGVMGSAMGALRWGFLGTTATTASATATAAARHQSSTSDSTSEEELESSPPQASSPFPSLWSPPAHLYAAHEYHDPPRKLEHCSVDPSGMYVAATDNFGRVLLLDLATKQLVRLWKGYRDGRCHWVLTNNDHDKNEKPTLYLVIHSRHRHVVESWRIHHERRSNFVQVSREAHVVPCTVWSRESLHSGCYLIDSLVPGMEENRLERINMVGETPDPLPESHRTPPRRKADDSSVATLTPTTSARTAALRLQHLQQLLSATNVSFSTQDVYKSLTQIEPGDLRVALDLIGGATVLEDKLGKQGAEFHKVALAHCQQRLQETLKVGDADTASNPHVQALADKVKFHSQIEKAFDEVAKFELSGAINSSGSKKNTAPSTWAAEAMGWVATQEHVTGTPLAAVVTVDDRKLRFSQLFNSCVFPSKTSDRPSDNVVSIYFSDSSRTRRDVLVHVFRPLQGDIFSLNVVYTVFDALGIRDDTNYILQCFGEWFMLLSKSDIYGSLLASNPPMTRFLRDLVSRQLRDQEKGDTGIALETLHTFCTKSNDIARAFLLCVFCREAVERASIQREKASYGKIMTAKLVEDWDKLLRKLRVSLLVSLRLTSAKLQAPLSVAHVDEGDLFSVYEWLALDELSMSHDQEEISLLEKACAISSFSFDPSTSEGDGHSKFKSLQNSCLASQISEAERAEYLVDFDDDDRFGALLLFLKSHNEPPMLAAHRALLLCSKWTKDPKDVKLLHDSFMALDALFSSAHHTLTAAVCLDIWKLCAIVFRAHLFGWDDIQEISEALFAPLLKDNDWLVSFGRVALRFLRILRAIEFDAEEDDLEPTATVSPESWPVPRPDFMLQRLVSRLYKFDETAVDTHCVVICALLVSSNVNALCECVPAVYDCFLPSSLANAVPATPDLAPLQYKFVEEAIQIHARDCPDKPMDRFNLQEIETLAHVWNIDVTGVRSQFVLTMYELEKDRGVDELLTKNPTHVDVRMFVEHGVDIACRRLAAFLNGERWDRRNVVGLLDADLCGWVLQRAEEGHWLVNNNDYFLSRIPMDKTNIFVMRLLSMAVAANIDASLRTKIHSLAKLSSSLLKELGGSANHR